MEQFIVFSNNKQNFALEISYVSRIIEYENPIKIPESSQFLMGVIKYNDKILPIIDLTKKLFGMSLDKHDDCKIIIIELKESQVGLLVDDVIGIHRFEGSQYEDSRIDTEVAKEYINGFIKLEDDITIVLEPDKLFVEEQKEELISASQEEL